jgi:hypothetical protein
LDELDEETGFGWAHTFPNLHQRGRELMGEVGDRRRGGGGRGRRRVSEGREGRMRMWMWMWMWMQMGVCRLLEAAAAEKGRGWDLGASGRG